MRKIIITFFGSGLIPYAPGTAGSLAASGVLALIWFYPGVSYEHWQAVLLVGLMVSSVLMLRLGSWTVLHFKNLDPPSCVLDEVAGICLTNLFLPTFKGQHELWAIGIAFLAFRLFDITKPPPARLLEKIPLGWGILLDDLAAAVYANLLCQVLLRVVLQSTL